MTRGFDPFADTDGKMEWEVIENADCPSIENVAEAETTDVDTLKKAYEMCDEYIEDAMLLTNVLGASSHCDAMVAALFKQTLNNIIPQTVLTL